MKENKLKILDVGCGHRKHPNATGIDFDVKSQADVIWDLNHLPLPFPNNYFDMIYAFHIIEHLTVEPIRFVEELHRICKPNGLLIIKEPHVGSRTACDISHLSPLKEYRKTSFECFYEGSPYRYTSKRLKLKRVELHYRMFDRESWWVRIINFLANRNINFCERVWRAWVGFFDEIYYEFKVIK
jgi:predicted SAM-dependent methyltransferase